MEQTDFSPDFDGTTLRMKVRIYWEDTDAGGVVYHASYIRFMERGRTEFLRAMDLEQLKLQAEQGLLIMVRHMAVDYLRPGRIDDVLTVETRLAKIGGASLHLEQKVRREEEILSKARVVCATVGRDGHAARIPEALRGRFSAAVATELQGEAGEP